MTDRIKNIALIAASITALALGGSAIAGAASGGGGNSSSSSGSSAFAASRGPASLPHQRSDETPLTGDTAAQVRKAALAKVSGGTILRVETDAEGNAAYEAHMVRSDGTPVTVYVNKSFDVVSIESGR